LVWQTEFFLSWPGVSGVNDRILSRKKPRLLRRSPLATSSQWHSNYCHCEEFE